VADGVNVNYDVYRIHTQVTEEGGRVDAGYYVDLRDRETRKVRWEELEENFEYDPNQLDRKVVAMDQIFGAELPKVLNELNKELAA